MAPPPNPNPRKRAAPGSSPTLQSAAMPQQPFPATNTLSNADLLRWNSPGGDMATFADPAGFNMNSYVGNGASFEQNVAGPASSTQLTRRPINRQLVPSASRSGFDDMGDWGQFGGEPILDGNGALEETDNIEVLEEKALVAKREAQAKRKQIPPFVQKLSSFLDESKNTELIRWSNRGDSFIVLDEDEFAKTLIPELFKHNNYASFVRQLNMYGFHKRVGLSDNSMKASERKNKSPSEYYNPYFKRGHPNLLWLINKPKSGTSGKKGNRKVKNEEGAEGDSDEEGRDGIEEIYGGNKDAALQGSRALSVAPESVPLPKGQIAIVQNQLASIQKQQGAISQAITRLRKDHNQLYQQAIAFQTLHDRHESSINAILTFLATVYNRSLDGQGNQNLAQMFGANGIPQDPHHNQGSVVEVPDNANQQLHNQGNLSPHRRQQRLLMAPPSATSANTPRSNIPTANAGYMRQQDPPRNGAGSIEELFEPSPAASSPIPIKTEPAASSSHLSTQGMNIVNNTNALANAAASSSSTPQANLPNMEFPAMLSHYETANGHTPLTSEQRTTMLNLIANAASPSPADANNALVSPTPPQTLSLVDLGYTQAEIDELARMQIEQQDRIDVLKGTMRAYSPGQEIPGFDDGVDAYFNNAGMGGGTGTGGGVGGGGGGDPQVGGNLDLDQYLDPDAFFATGSDLGLDANGNVTGAGGAGAGGDFRGFDYDAFATGGAGDAGDAGFDLSFDGTNDDEGYVKGKVETTENSSAGQTPSEGGGGTGLDEGFVAGDAGAGAAGRSGLGSPNKRRKKG